MLWTTVCCRWLRYRSGIFSVRRHWLLFLTGKDSSSVWCNLSLSLGKKSPEKGVATPSDLARVSRVSKLLFHVRRSLESWTAEQALVSGLKQTSRLTSSTLLSHCDSLGQLVSLPDEGSPGRGMCSRVGIQGASSPLSFRDTHCLPPKSLRSKRDTGSYQEPKYDSWMALFLTTIIRSTNTKCPRVKSEQACSSAVRARAWSVPGPGFSSLYNKKESMPTNSNSWA